MTRRLGEQQAVSILNTTERLPTGGFSDFDRKFSWACLGLGLGLGLGAWDFAAPATGGSGAGGI